MQRAAWPEVGRRAEVLCLLCGGAAADGFHFCRSAIREVAAAFFFRRRRIRRHVQRHVRPVGGWFSNASVYHVTTTQDLVDRSGKPQQGTLRGAFYDYTNPSSPKQQASNRIVVFDVGGVFDISANTLDIKTVNNIYVAGQTAPSPVTVYGNTTQITKSNNTMTSNVILRYLTFRKGTGSGEDAITFSGGNGPGDTVATNMILDHVSASWAEDEVLSVANNNTNVTVQYSIIADSLTNGHAYGSLDPAEGGF